MNLTGVIDAADGELSIYTPSGVNAVIELAQFERPPSTGVTDKGAVEYIHRSNFDLTNGEFTTIAPAYVQSEKIMFVGQTLKQHNGVYQRGFPEQWVGTGDGGAGSGIPQFATMLQTVWGGGSATVSSSQDIRQQAPYPEFLGPVVTPCELNIASPYWEVQSSGKVYFIDSNSAIDPINHAGTYAALEGGGTMTAQYEGVADVGMYGGGNIYSFNFTAGQRVTQFRFVGTEASLALTFIASNPIKETRRADGWGDMQYGDWANCLQDGLNYMVTSPNPIVVGTSRIQFSGITSAIPTANMRVGTTYIMKAPIDKKARFCNFVVKNGDTLKISASAPCHYSINIRVLAI